MDDNSTSKQPPIIPSISQEQIHDLLFSREIGWQEIIYDLINTEQLDPWNINLTILTDKYILKIRELEEADFFVSSKVLLAASLLLRIKSEILLNKYIKSIDEILFGREEKKKYELERIELDEEIPLLVPRSPIPRFKKVTLKELMDSLNKAIITENRRIKKTLIDRNALREVGISIPKRKFSIKDKIREIYERLTQHLSEDKELKKVSYTDFIGKDKDERILSFYPLLELENRKRVWLEQEAHFDEIFIWLKDIYFKHNPDPFADLREKVEEQIEEIKKDRQGEARVDKIGDEFSNPLGEE